jgi:hypothetical protein
MLVTEPPPFTCTVTTRGALAPGAVTVRSRPLTYPNVIVCPYPNVIVCPARVITLASCGFVPVLE